MRLYSLDQPIEGPILFSKPKKQDHEILVDQFKVITVMLQRLIFQEFLDKYFFFFFGGVMVILLRSILF